MYAIIVLLAGTGTLFMAFREQHSLDKAVEPTVNPLGVMGQMRRRYQAGVNRWWMSGCILSVLGVVFVVSTLLFGHG